MLKRSESSKAKLDKTIKNKSARFDFDLNLDTTVTARHDFDLNHRMLSEKFQDGTLMLNTRP